MIKNYFIPQTLEEAVSLKKTHGEGAKYLAGGTELNLRINKEKYHTFIDLREINCDKIEKLEDGSLAIGAGVTFQTLSTDSRVPQQLKKAATYMESRNVRNMATLGGNIGSGRTMGDLLPTLMVLDARVKLVGKNTLVTVEDYIHNRQDDLIEKVVIHGKDLNRSFGSRVHMRTSNDISIVGAAATYEVVDGRVYGIKIALGGVAKKVIRLREVEKALEGQEASRDLVVTLVKSHIDPLGDVRGSKEFKSHMAAELVLESLGIN